MNPKAKRQPAHASQFCRHAPEAKAVYLAGSFNEWNPEDLAMEKGAEGTWSLNLDLPPGRYEYKFVVDGAWSCGEPCCNDRNVECDKCVQNSFGTMNHVIQID